MGIAKQSTHLCQSINVGGFRLRMAAQASYPVIEVINRNQEHIWFALGKRRGSRKNHSHRNQHNGFFEVHGKYPEGILSHTQLNFIGIRMIYLTRTHSH